MTDHGQLDIFAGFVPDTARAMRDGWVQDDAHFYPLIVQFEDTDAGGIVYHANYLSFAERGRSGWLRILGISQNDNLYDEKVGFVVRRASLDYLRPAKLLDEVIVETKLKQASRVKMTAEQIIRGIDQQPAGAKAKNLRDCPIFAKVEVEIVMVNDGGRPIRFPQQIMDAMLPDAGLPDAGLPNAGSDNHVGS